MELLGGRCLAALEGRLMVEHRDDVQELSRLLVGTPPGPTVDWKRVVALAQLHGVSALLFWRLKQQENPKEGGDGAAGDWHDVPQAIGTGLQVGYYRAVAQRVVEDVALTRVLDVLEAARVPVVLLKGAALARSVYPDPVLRSMSDVDVLVPVESLALVDEQLARLGYHRASDEVPGHRPKRFMRRFGKVWVYRGPLCLEVHHKLVGGEWIRWVSGMAEVAAEVRERAVPVHNGSHALQLSPEDTLLHLCVHLAVINAFTGVVLRNLMDVALVLDRESIRWPELLERARRWRVATACYVALDAAARLLDAQIPDWVLGGLQPGAGRRLVLHWILDERALVENPWRFVGLRRFLLQFLLIDRLSDALSLLRHTFFPDRSWLMLRYELESCPRWRVRLQQLWHPLRVVLRGEV
jgi:hypothetical protein